MNSPLAKSARRVQRESEKRAAAKRITHLGIYIQPAVVRNHRYMKSKGLGYCPEIANVHLRSDWGTTPGGNSVAA